MRNCWQRSDNMIDLPRQVPALILWAVITLAACSDSLWDAPAAGSVAAESASPDKSLLVRVLAAEVHGAYTLEVQDVRTGRLLGQRTVEAPVGYHPHLFILTWSEDSRTVTVAIDHDFGDYESVFDLHVEHKHE